MRRESLSHSGALKSVGSLPCELELEQCLHLPSPGPPWLGPNLPTWSPTIAHIPHSPGIHFQNQGEFPYLLYPVPPPAPFIFILLCLEETPPTKNQPPEAKTKPDTPSASPLLPRENSLKKKKIPCLYKEDRTQRGNGALLSTKAASEAESSKALGVSCCLIYINGRIKFLQGVETGHSVCFSCGNL